MACRNHVNLCVAKNATFHATFRWALESLVSKAISAISQSAPAVVTAAAHGVPSNWPVAVVSADGMEEINSEYFPPRVIDMSPALVMDVNNVALQGVNSSDFDEYDGGGTLVYYSPGDLTGIVAATFKVYDNPMYEGTPLVDLAIGTGITVTDLTKTIVVRFDAAGMDWAVGYYQLLLDDGTRDIELADGELTIEV